MLHAEQADAAFEPAYLAAGGVGGRDGVTASGEVGGGPDVSQLPTVLSGQHYQYLYTISK